MSAERLLRRLRAAKFALRVDWEQLAVSPAENLTDWIRGLIRTRKPELRRLLGCTVSAGRPTCLDCRTMLPLGGVRCPRCRDAKPEPTCASCGSVIGRPHPSVCDLCRLEADTVAEPKNRPKNVSGEGTP